jgi:TPR repeat protein
MYEKGLGVRRDADRATAMTRRACDNGYKAACPKPKAT